MTKLALGWLVCGLAAIPLAQAADPGGATNQNRLQWPAWQCPAEPVTDKGSLVIVADDQAESKRPKPVKPGEAPAEEPVALMRRVTRQAIAKGDLSLAVSPAVRWAQLKPGLYRISARVKIDGGVNLIGTPLRLYVRPVLIDPQGKPSVDAVANITLSQSYYGYEFKEAGQYQVVSFLYEVDPTGLKRLRAQEPLQPSRILTGLYEDPTVKKEPPKAGDGLVVGFMLPRTKFNAQAGWPANSLRTVSLDWLTMERVEPSPSITVRHVRPEKQWLRPGDKTTFSVGLENFTGAAQKRTLRLSLVRGFDERLVLREEAIALAPGETKALAVPWQTAGNTPAWGWEVCAEIRNNDRTESSARDFFSVHPSAYDVHIMGANSRVEDPFREPGSHQNLVEQFGATRGDMAQLTAPDEQWIGGMMEVPYSYASTKQAIEHNARLGIQTIMYLFAGGTGLPVMDLYVRKPEWFSGRMTGTDEVYAKQKAVQELVRNFDFRNQKYPNPMVPHMELALNFWDPACMAMITKDTIEFIRRTGYGGIRFDVGMFGPRSTVTCYGEKLPYDMTNAMTVGAGNFNGYCEALRKAYPGFEFGANMDTWAYLENVGNRSQTPPDPETFPEFTAFAKAGGMFMDEGTMNAPIYFHYMNRFEDGFWGMCQKREMARRYGGLYQLFSPHRDGNGYFAHDDIYWAAMIIASGSYYVGRFSAMPYSDDSVGAFIARFGEFFRSKGLKPLAGAADLVLVDAPGNVWYADAVVWEDIGPRRRYVIPLLNAPIVERMRRNKTGDLPPPINEPFPVEVTVPEGFKTAKAWMLTWEPAIGAHPLPVTLANGRARVKVPALQLFRTVVMEFER